MKIWAPYIYFTALAAIVLYLLYKAGGVAWNLILAALNGGTPPVSQSGADITAGTQGLNFPNDLSDLGGN